LLLARWRQAIGLWKFLGQDFPRLAPNSFR
jgi:hypothetical protein